MEAGKKRGATEKSSKIRPQGGESNEKGTENRGTAIRFKHTGVGKFLRSRNQETTKAISRNDNAKAVVVAEESRGD